MTNRIILTPYSKISQKDLRKTVFERCVGSTYFWDDSYRNTAQVGDKFAVTFNRTGNTPLVLAYGKVIRILCEFCEEGEAIIAEWDGHQKGRQILEIEPLAFPGIYLQDLCTKPTKVWGTQRRTLLS